METRLQELKKFESEMRASVTAYHTSITRISESLNTNRQEMNSMQERATTLQSVVDKVVVTLDEHSIILDEIRESLKVISGKSKGISTDSTLTEPQSQQVHQSGGQSGVFQPSFNTVRNPPFTPPLAPINIPATMHSPSQFQPSVYPTNQAAFSTSQNAFTVDNPPGIRTLLRASLI